MREYKEIDIVLPDDIKQQIREWHDSDTVVGLCCNAHGEGLNCCVDFLLGDASWRKDFLKQDG